MKKLPVLMIVIFLLSSCTSTEVLPTQTPTLTSTLEFTKTPTATATETPLPTLLPTATLAPFKVDCIINDKTSTEKDCQLIRDAVDLGRHYLLNNFGKDISGTLQIKLLSQPNNVKGGSYDQGFSGHMNSKDPNNGVIEINTAHPFWSEYTSADNLYRHTEGVIHEFTHFWELQHGCWKGDDLHYGILNFLNEGQAAYISDMAIGKPELINPGQSVVNWTHWNYDNTLWFNDTATAEVAFRDLMEQYSPGQYLNYCDLLLKGTRPETAFQSVFGTTIQDYRNQFKERTLGILKDCTQATCGPKLGKEDPKYGNLTPMIDYSLKEPNLIIKIVDQQGKPAPKITLQLFRKYYNNLYYGTDSSATTNADGILAAPVLPGTLAMTFCEPTGWTIGHYPAHPTKCVYELNNFDVLPGQNKTIEFKYWNIYDKNLREPNFIFTLLGADGQPVGNQYVQVCGYDAVSTVCLNGKTDNGGNFKTSLMAGNYLVRLVQPGQGRMDPRGVTDPEKGMNVNPYSQVTKDFEYEIRDITVVNSRVTDLTYQFPAPTLKIQFLDANGSSVPSVNFLLCKSLSEPSETPEEKAASDKMLTSIYADWGSHKNQVGEINGDCFLIDHTDKQGVFQIHVDAGNYFIYYDNPGSLLYESYFDHVMMDIVVSNKDVTAVSAEFK